MSWSIRGNVGVFSDVMKQTFPGPSGICENSEKMTSHAEMEKPCSNLKSQLASSKTSAEFWEEETF